MSDSKNMFRLYEILHEGDFDLSLYVYRLDRRGKRQKPFLFRTYPHDELLDTLREKYGGGDFSIIIRDGNKMVLSEVISVWGALNRG